MARKKRHIKSRPAIAVLGEGITEREYFKSLKKYRKLPFKFKPEIPKHSDIQSIVNKANALDEIFDKVFCIIDLDRIYANTKERKLYNELKAKNRNLYFIEHYPCLEIWLLLHYEYSTRAYTSCNHLTKFLKKYINDYQKSENYLSKKDLFLFLKEGLDFAMKNAKQLEKKDIGSKCDMYKVMLQLNKLSQNN